MQPAHDAATHTPDSQRWSLAHVPQKLRAGPHASMPLLGAHEPSGKQHADAHRHSVGGPASTTPASITGASSHFALTQRSVFLQRTHELPKSPHSNRSVPGTHSLPEQHPKHVDALHGFSQAESNIRKTKANHRMGRPVWHRAGVPSRGAV